VLSFKDSVVTILGLNGVQANELIYFEGGASGVALNLEYNIVKALVFGGANSVRTSEMVKRSKVVMRVGVGHSILGRIANPLGVAIDGLGDIKFDVFNPIEKKAPGVITRKKINQSIETGLKVVDALVPIGRGQRELILGDRKTGKTTIAIDAILNQIESQKKFRDTVSCIYVAVGKRMAEIVRITRLLKQRGAMSYTAVIVARASDPASLQFIAPYSACTMAEYFTYRGEHALIIYDDLSRHADAYRQISLLLRRPVGREAYPGDIFYLHSRLLERAVKLDMAYGGGSLTALPVVETIQGDVSAYIPTNVISITDGQIYLDLNRHQEGVRPAVDPGLSVSRVGSSAQARLMKKLSGSLKLELAQFREVEQFSKFGSELDATTRNLLLRGRLMVNLLKQPRNKPLSAYSQLFILYVSKTKFFEEHVLSISGVDVDAYFSSLFAFIGFMSVLVPGKVAFEHQSSIEKAEVLEGLLMAHLHYFFETSAAALEPKSKLYFAFNSAAFDDTVDAGLKSSALTKEFKE
jgi:F-type H+-transporting ATPase subunit alpha